MWGCSYKCLLHTPWLHTQSWTHWAIRWWWKWDKYLKIESFLLVGGIFWSSFIWRHTSHVLGSILIGSFSEIVPNSFFPETLKNTTLPSSWYLPEPTSHWPHVDRDSYFRSLLLGKIAHRKKILKIPPPQQGNSSARRFNTMAFNPSLKQQLLVNWSYNTLLLTWESPTLERL